MDFTELYGSIYDHREDVTSMFAALWTGNVPLGVGAVAEALDFTSDLGIPLVSDAADAALDIADFTFDTVGEVFDALGAAGRALNVFNF